MNERVMQFRIGMFVIVAGLVLTMLIVWFGESPTLFRDNAYVTVHFIEAPGIDVGIPVRKSGIRIGEVAELKFDDRRPEAQGVLVTLAIERKYRSGGRHSAAAFAGADRRRVDRHAAGWRRGADRVERDAE